MLEFAENGLFFIVIISMSVGLEVWGIYKLKYYQKIKREMLPEKYDNYTNNIDLEKNFKIGVIAWPIIFLLILLGFYLIFNTSIEPDFDNKDRIVGLVFCAIFIVAPFFLTLVLFLKKQKEMKGYKKCLLSKYGNVYVKRIFKSQIVEGDMNTTGSIRYKYVFSFVVPNYNCVVSQYYYQKLIVTRSRGRKNRSWDTLYTMLEYKYININNFPNFNDERVQGILNELSKTRSLFFETNYDSFIVRKIAAENPTEKQIQDNINDIEVIYTCLLKGVSEFDNCQNSVQ